MSLYSNKHYLEDVHSVVVLNLPWIKLQNKSILISGATGMIGSFLVDVLMKKNVADNLNCTVYALGRSEEKLKSRFSKYADDARLIFVQYNIQEPFACSYLGNVDYVLHLLSFFVQIKNLPLILRFYHMQNKLEVRHFQ